MTTAHLPPTMRALQQLSFEGIEAMHLIDAPVPVPGDNEILVRVAAAGVNFADLSRAHGTFLNGPQPPFLAGFEAAGEVVATGAAVEIPLGSSVVGVGVGAFAEYLVMRAATAMPLPAGWNAKQALGLMVNWPTAIAALKPLGRLAVGETVLIHAAAGATGQAALKIAKHGGARVIASASARKHEALRALGADHVLGSGREDLAAQVLELTSGAGADLVLESAGGATFAASLAAAKRVTGRVVVYGLSGGNASISNWDLVYRYPVQVMGFNLGTLIGAAPQVFGAVMGEMSRLIAAGVITPAEPRSYALSDGPRALAELEARATIGKLALIP